MRVFRELRMSNDMGEERWRWVAPWRSKDMILRLLAFIHLFISLPLVLRVKPHLEIFPTYYL